MNLHRVTNNGYEPENTDGRSVIPRRLPPVPNLSPLRSPSSPISSASPSPPSSVSSLSPSSFGSPSPASSPGSASSNYSPTKALNVLKRTPPRPLPQIPSSRHVSSPTQKQPMTNQDAQLIVCRSCMNCVTTSESLLPSSAVPPGSRAFRGFSGKASLFTEVYNITASAPRVQLMTTGAHTMQEIFCGNCSVCLGWKIVRAHERTEKWKEGKWLLELENLWLARSSDVLDSRFEKEVERERERQGKREMTGYSRDAVTIANVTTENGLGLEFVDSGAGLTPRGTKGYTPTVGHHRFSRSTPSFGMKAYHASGSAIHLPMTIAT